MQGLPAYQRVLVLHAIERQLSYEPEVETRNRKRLRPNPIAPWELRVGNRRVFYDVDSRKGAVEVLAVGRKEGNRLLIGKEEVEL